LRFREQICWDLSWHHVVDGVPVPPKWGRFRIALAYLKYRGFRAVFLYRMAHRFYLRHHFVIASMISRHMFRSCGCEISPDAVIQEGLRLPHPQGVLIGSNCLIGKMVTLGQHATLGGNFWKRDVTGSGRPKIGDYCWIATGAVVVGPVDIGFGSIIGANSVVTISIPPKSGVTGNPGRVRMSYIDDKYSRRA
jgi:serine O-acetyltransferase